jgi:hypothetical protein
MDATTSGYEETNKSVDEVRGGFLVAFEMSLKNLVG